MAIVSTGSLTIKDMNDAKQLSMFIAGSQSKQVMYDGVSTYVPNYSSTPNVLTAQLRIAGGGADVSAGATATRWYVQNGGAGAILAITGTANTDLTVGGFTYQINAVQPITLTIKSNVFATQATMNYICEMDYIDPDTGFLVTSKSDYQVTRVTNGVSAIVAVVTNENVTLPATSASSITSYAGSNTDIQVWEGSTALIYDTAFVNNATYNGKYKITATTARVTKGTETGSGTNKYSMGVVSGIGTAVPADDTATITFQIDGRTSAGATINISKTMNISKSKAGVGTDSVIRYLSMPNTFGKKADGSYVATSVAINAWQVTGNGGAVAYNGFIMIQTSVLGDFTDAVTAIANTTAVGAGGIYTWTVTTGIKAFRATLYTGSGGVGQMDSETCYIIQDGTNSIYTKIWCPVGNAIHNSTGSLDIQADIFDGINIVTGTYKWYKQNPLATTVSLGDAEGGNGWQLVINVANPTVNPTISAPVTGGSTLTATTYYIKYTWVSLTGETIGNTNQMTQIVASGQGLNIVVPAFPSGVFSANVYVGTVTGDANLYYQGKIGTSAGSLLIKTPIVTISPKIPTVTSAVSTASTLTVQAFGIAGMESFKCSATYLGNRYTNVISVQDSSDPIMVDVQGVDIFKNGTGTTILKAVLWQGGIEIDPTGTIYTYSWALYDSANAPITTTYSTLNTGKSVTVDGRDFVGVANVLCTISK